MTAQSLPDYDYSNFTGAPSNDAAPEPLQLLQARERITAGQVNALYWLSSVCFHTECTLLFFSTSSRRDTTEGSTLICVCDEGIAQCMHVCLSVMQLHQLLDRGTTIHLVDVRPREQFEIAHMPGEVR